MSTAAAPAVPSGNLPPESVIFGRSGPMRDVQRRLEKVAGANVPVLIQGESGTGKEIIAKLVHRLSPWNSGPFVKVNCPAIPGTLIESELFGYEKGAFTGAYGTKMGRVELANRGTLFLDEIGELDMGLQAKLLQVLQDGQFCRIGAQEEKRMEARFVCATNRRLEDEVAEGGFRQDLFYRINVVNITLPPLRERTQDVPELVNYFVQFYSESFNRPVPRLSSNTLQALQAYHWPGNIRQLENLMKRYVILGSHEVITSELMNTPEPEEGDGLEIELPANGNVSLKKLTKEAVLRLEKKIIVQVLERHHWNRKKAARALNISYRALLYKLKEAGLQNGSELPHGAPIERPDGGVL